MRFALRRTRYSNESVIAMIGLQWFSSLICSLSQMEISRKKRIVMCSLVTGGAMLAIFVHALPRSACRIYTHTSRVYNSKRFSLEVWRWRENEPKTTPCISMCRTKNGHEPNTKSTVKRDKNDTERGRDRERMEKLNENWREAKQRFPHSIPFYSKYLKRY